MLEELVHALAPRGRHVAIVLVWKSLQKSDLDAVPAKPLAPPFLKLIETLLHPHHNSLRCDKGFIFQGNHHARVDR